LQVENQVPPSNKQANSTNEDKAVLGLVKVQTVKVLGPELLRNDQPVQILRAKTEEWLKAVIIMGTEVHLLTHLALCLSTTTSWEVMFQETVT
jgi:hypothetical protein